MNVKAAVKAAGVYFAFGVALGAWIVGMVFAVISRSDAFIFLAVFAPILLLIAGGFVWLIVVAPFRRLYEHFDKVARK